MSLCCAARTFSFPQYRETLVHSMRCCCNHRTRSVITYSTFDFANESPIYALYFTHSVWWIPFKRDTLGHPRVRHRRQRRPTDVGLTKKKPKKNNIFRIFCNRWWPENIKCWALIYTHHVSTRSDQIEIAHAQINSTAFHIQRRFTINATHRRKKKKRNKFLAYFGGQVRHWSEKIHRVYQMIIVIH